MNDATTIGSTAYLKDLQARLAAKGVTPYQGEIPKGETPEERDERHKAARAAARTRWEARRPVMYTDATVSSLGPEQGSSEIAAWFNDPEALNLILAGAVGTGKTYAGYAVGNHLIDLGTGTVEAWTAHDLLEAMRPNGETAPHAPHVDVLLLDDLGAAQPTEWAVETLTALLDQRLRENRRTIVTTNLDAERLGAAWGERLLDRLRHRSTVVAFRGESRRIAAW